MKTQEISPIERIVLQVKPIVARDYKGGRELRFADLTKGKTEVQRLIESGNLPIEIFETDISLRSVAIRLKEK